MGAIGLVRRAQALEGQDSLKQQNVWGCECLCQLYTRTRATSAVHNSKYVLMTQSYVCIHVRTYVHMHAHT